MLSVVLAAALVIMGLNMLGSLARGRKVNASLEQGAMLANQLMAEVMQCSYKDPSGTAVFGPETGEVNGTRSLFEDVDDYNGWVEASAQYKDGTAMASLTGWKRQVVVEYLNPDTMATCGATDMGLKRITVTVTAPGGAVTTLVGLRGADGTFDQHPAQQTTCISYVGMELQVGSDSRSRVFSGACVPNVVP